jgi:hypothetical protein
MVSTFVKEVGQESKERTSKREMDKIVARAWDDVK